MEKRAERTFIPFVAALLLLALAAGPAGAEETEQQQQGVFPELFFESVDVNVVNIEVTVTDESGEPVLGLTKDDFEIFEDGEPVEVTNFFAVEGRSAVGAAETDGSGQAMQPETRSLLLVIYVDNLNIRPENRNRTFDQLRGFLREELDPRDRVMIVTFNGRLDVTQRFTQDIDAVEAALAEVERETGQFIRLTVEKERILRQIQRVPLYPAPNPAGGAVDIGDFELAVSASRALVQTIENLVQATTQNIRATVDGLKRFTDSLAGMPGRKAILYISDGIPTRPGEDLTQAWRNRFELWATSQQVTDVLREMPRLNTIPKNTSGLFRDLVQHASAHRVAFYPISHSLRDGVGASSAEFSGAGTSDGAGSFSRDVLTLDAVSRESSLLTMAGGTGGVAFTRSSNLSGLLEKMVEDFSTFYSLGYTPIDPGTEDFHKVEVKVKRPGLTVRHVKGYKKLDALEQMENLTLSALYFNFEDNPLGVELVTGQYNETAAGFYRVPLLIQIPFEKLALLPQEGVYAGQVLAFVIVQDEKGDLSPFQRIALPISIPEARFEEAMAARAGYQVDLVMRKGKHRISVGVRDNIADVETTVNLDVEIGIGTGEELAAGGEPSAPGAE